MRDQPRRGQGVTGTILNTAAVLVGSGVGLVIGNRLPNRVRETVMSGMALAVLLIGVQMALKTENVLIALGSVVLGGIVGELLGIENALEGLGKRIEASLNRRAFATGSGESREVAVDGHTSRFVRGFMTASLLYCVGPMTILGSIQDGLTGDYSTLAVKSMLDGFGSIAFASSLGVGVAFSAIVVFVYQGALTLAAAWIKGLLTDAMIREMTAVGGPRHQHARASPHSRRQPLTSAPIRPSHRRHAGGSQAVDWHRLRK